MYTININTKKSELNLQPGFYDVFITGGFHVNYYHGFIINLQSFENNQRIKIISTRQVRSIEKGQRAVKCFRFELITKGKYELVISNPNDLTIKKSIFFPVNWFLTLPEDKIKNIIISRQMDQNYPHLYATRFDT
jgi:hypothetical protein